jgi:hypothetical protein
VEDESEGEPAEHQVPKAEIQQELRVALAAPRAEEQGQ